MTVSRQLWVLAGGNGAGKSTFHRLFLAPRGVKLLNADLIGIQEFEATRGQKQTMECRFAGPIAAG